MIDDHMQSARCRTRLDVTNRGRDLFEIVDLDRSQSLSDREFAQAARRIPLWDSDGDGAVSQSEIPQLFQLSFGPGQPEFPGLRFPGAAGRTVEQDSTTRGSAPVWFTKLDRNSDGELVRREFPGTFDEFQKMDRNGDGFVDAAEAEFVK
ncbi:MAG: hypothetical protein R3C19_23290 [Planctomycetaceae bacterium]